MLTEQGRFMGISRNVLLRRQQYRIADMPAVALPIVAAMVTAKIANSRLILLRGARESADEALQTLRSKANHLSHMGLAASRAGTIDETRGYEGLAPQDYFSVFNELIASDSEGFRFGGRTRRPPLDRVKAMLSFVYALLH